MDTVVWRFASRLRRTYIIGNLNGAYNPRGVVQ